MKTVQAGPFSYAADFIEGLDDAEAGAIAGAMSASGAPADSGAKIGTMAPTMNTNLREGENKTFDRWKKLING